VPNFSLRRLSELKIDVVEVSDFLRIGLGGSVRLKRPMRLKGYSMKVNFVV